MNEVELCFLSIAEMSSLLRARQISCLELVEAHLDRIQRYDDAVRAFITGFDEGARVAAARADAALMTGRPLGELHGIPVAIKDEAGRAGFPGTFGCLALREHIAQTDAVHTERLINAGAIVLGTTNLPEIGHRGTTSNRLRGSTSTPFDLSMNAGGSSGGSAAAVASGMVAGAHGADGGGSVRIPAAMCGVVGLIGSYGRVPRLTRPDAFNGRGNFPNDGVITRTVADAALMINVIAGYDPRDPFAIPAPPPELDGITGRGSETLRVGWTPDFGVFPVEQSVRNTVWSTAQALKDAGVPVEEVAFDPGCTNASISDVWRRSAAVEYAAMAAYLKRQGVDLLGAARDAVDPNLIAFIEEGRKLSALEVRLDDEIRTRIFDEFTRQFQQFDVLISPTVGVAGVSNDEAARRHGPTSVAGQAIGTLGWVLTAPVNFCGFPAMSVPAGFIDGLPTGMQIIAPRGSEKRCLELASAVEQVAPWRASYANVQRALDQTLDAVA